MASSAAAYAQILESPRQNFANVLPSLGRLQLRLQDEHREVELLFVNDANRLLSSHYSEQGSGLKESLQRHERTFARLTEELTRLNDQAQKMTQAEAPLASAAMNAARSAILTQRSLRDRLNAAVPNMETVLKLTGIVGKLFSSEGNIAPELSEQMNKDLAAMRESAASEYMPANVRSLIESAPSVLAIAAKTPYHNSFYETLREMMALFPREEREELGQEFQGAIATLRELDESASKMAMESGVLRERLSGCSARIEELVQTLEETGAAIKAAFGEYRDLQSKTAALSDKQVGVLREMVDVEDRVIKKLQQSGQETDALRGQLEEMTGVLRETEQRSREQLAKIAAERDSLAQKAQAFQSALSNIDAWVGTVRGQMAPAPAAPADK